MAMFPVCMAFMPAASAEETANVVETAKGTPGYDGSATVYN
ncbi:MULTISPECIES: hypothetical protein [Methanosarcina]|nr:MULTISPECIES: hypothetical protein [Methanosarcina]